MKTLPALPVSASASVDLSGTYRAARSATHLPPIPILTPKGHAMHRIQHLHPRHSLGFTLIELMVTVSVLGVLLAIALPSFQPLIERWRVRQVESNLEASLQFARSEAIKRGGHIIMQKITTNTNGCTAPSPQREWDCGWFICIDGSVNGKKNENCEVKEAVLLRYEQRERPVFRYQRGRNHQIQSLRSGFWKLILASTLCPKNKTINNPPHKAYA